MASKDTGQAADDKNKDDAVDEKQQLPPSTSVADEQGNQSNSAKPVKESSVPGTSKESPDNKSMGILGQLTKGIRSRSRSIPSPDRDEALFSLKGVSASVTGLKKPLKGGMSALSSVIKKPLKGGLAMLSKTLSVTEQVKATEAPTLSEEAPKSAEETPKPVEEKTKPAQETPKSTEEPPKSAKETPKPAEETPKFIIEKSLKPTDSISETSKKEEKIPGSKSAVYNKIEELPESLPTVSVEIPPVVKDGTKPSKDIEAAHPAKLVQGEEFVLEVFIKEYLPWIAIAATGFVLLLVAVVLLAAGTGNKIQLNLSNLNIPNLQGNFKVFNIDGKALRYSNELSYVGNLEARKLRQKVEPKLENIYRAADLNVDKVLVLSYKYGNAGSTNLAKAKRSVAKEGTSIIIRHWVYLKENISLDINEIQGKVVLAAKKEPDIGIDVDSIQLFDLSNITRVQALTVLTQYGFFQNSIDKLDMELLTKLGVIFGPSGFGVQKEEDEGLCPSLLVEDYLNVTPSTCTESTRTYSGLVCSFSCPSTHYLVGSPSRICLLSGHWSGTPAECKDTCSSITSPTEGSLLPDFCSIDSMAVGQICFIQCPVSYRLYSNSDPNLGGSSYFRECQNNGKWTNGIGFCKAKCSSMNIPQHFKISVAACLTDSSVGDICTITCQAGYVLEGGGTVQQLTCDAHGVWDKAPTQCKKSCSGIAATSSLTISPALCSTAPYQGIKCTYQCSTQGYKLVGKSISVCTSSGWSDPPPTCVRVCPQLESVANGVFISEEGNCMDKNPLGDTRCKLMCDIGFLPSEAYTTCAKSSGSWSSQNMKCQRICMPLKNSNFGTWSPSDCSTGYASRCTITCASGYNIVGDSSLTCNFTSGEWNNEPGICTKTCSSQSAPTSGTIEPSSKCGSNPIPGTICKYSCSVGFELVGERSLTCGENGQWSPSAAPTCSSVTQYIVHTSIPNICLTVDGKNNVIKSKDGCSSISEKNRWMLTGGQLKNAYSKQCLSQGENLLEAVMADCASAATQVFEGSFINKVRLSSSNKYYLVQGARTSKSIGFLPVVGLDDTKSDWNFADASVSSGSATMKSFSGVSGMCSAFVVGSFMSVNNRCDQEEKAFRTTCALSCTSGYQLNEASISNTVCQDTGKWQTSASLKCIADSPSASVTCASFPQTLQNDVVVSPPTCTTGSSQYGTTCTFSCANSNKYIDGVSSVTCTRYATWSSYATSICQTYCPPLIANENSRLSSSSPVSCGNGKAKSGSVCMFDCDDGYLPEAEAILTCTDSGSWDGPLPTCSKMCLAFEDSKLQTECTMSKRNNKYSSGTVCTLSCPAGYSLQANKSVTCLSDGTWSDSQLHCAPTCSIFKKFANETIIPNSCSNTLSEVGTTCTATCNVGYYIANSMLTKTIKRTCGNDGMWQGDISFCMKACPALPSVVDGGNGYYEPSACSASPQLPGSICNLRCHGLFKVHGGASSLNCSEGSWIPSGSETKMGACLSSCKSLAKSKYATVSPYNCLEGPVDPGTKCIIECPSHMERMGPGVVTCLGKSDPASASVTSSFWSNAEGTKCLAKCPPLPSTSSMFMFPKNCAYNYQLEKTTCSFECERGMKLDGPISITCMANGMWSDLMPVCYHTCLGVQVFGGRLYCSVVGNINAAGYSFFPGTRCSYLCNSGYAAFWYNEVTCMSHGAWMYPPYCQANTNTFTIFQKVNNVTKCLITTWNNDLVGSNWILSFVQSKESCIAEENNALWWWFVNNLIRHALTGLCITAEQSKNESLIVLEHCNVTNVLQHWECDVSSPYRIILKGTNLGIDTFYDKVGPILQEWIHTQSSWLTFNKDLEVSASLCSYKTKGTCPALKLPNLKVSPPACSTDQVSAWQECELSCDSGTSLKEGISKTTCLLTGVWENIEKIGCVRMCSRAPAGGAAIYEPSSCGTSSMPHKQTCTASCMKHVKTIDMEDQYAYACDNGKWSGQTFVCGSQCYPGADAIAKCEDTVCKYMCQPGFKISSGSQISQCDENGNINESPPNCAADTQFVIQAKSMNGPQNTKICLTLKYGVSNRDSTSVETMKTICNIDDSSQYWKWDGDKLQHVFSGLCLSAEAGDWSILNGSTCGNGNNQKFACLNNLFPYHVQSKMNESNVIDFGWNTDNAPAVVTSDIFSSGAWLAVGPNNENPGTICSFKESGVCPPLVIGSTSTFQTSNCDSSSTKSSECQINCASGHTLNVASGSSYTLKCNDNGEWSGPVQACVAASSGSCTAPTKNDHLLVSPNCFSSTTLYSGTVCLYSCDAGYNLIGNSINICAGSSGWTTSPSSPMCKALCPGILPENGSVTPAKCSGVMVNEGTVCTQTCNSGYKVTSGDASITCNGDSSWSGSVISCEKHCPLLSLDPYKATADSNDVVAGTHKVVTSSTCANNPQDVGSTCSFSCPTGQVVFGNSNSTCGKMHMWLSPIPQCIAPTSCPNPDATNVQKHFLEPLLNGGTITAGTAVYLTCNNGFVIDGDEVRVCMKNGLWGGNGPTTPACSKLCPPLSKKLKGVITPSSCYTQYSRSTATCTLSCEGNTQFPSGAKTIDITCTNGAWSRSFPVCTYPSDSNEANQEYNSFLMITQGSKRGCFFPGNNSVIEWATIATCNANNSKYLWKWTDNQAIMNLEFNKCLKPVNVSGRTFLGLGNCDDSPVERFGCGNPESSLDWAMLYYLPSNKWELKYTYETYSGDIASISAMKVSNSLQRFSPYTFQTIETVATSDPAYPAHMDKSICSFQCGGKLTSEPASGIIASPGFLRNEMYPVFSSCVWIFTGFNNKITLTLLELDLESSVNSNNPCEKDCVQIFKGDTDAITMADLVKTFTGNDVSAYNTLSGGNVISTILGYLYVKFKSDGSGNNKGFAMNYSYTELPQPASCGMPTNTLHILRLDEEVPLGLQSNIKQWPWVVSIRETTVKKGKAYHRCTGVLIDDTTVISAAHCARFVVKALNREDGITVGVGQSSQFGMDDDLREGRGIVVDRVFIHPEYDYLTRRNDIAVWKLMTKVNFTDSVKPICAPLDGYSIQDVDSNCYAAGWTQLDNGVAVRHIVSLRMVIDTTSYCEKVLGLDSGSRFVCANYIRLDRSVRVGSEYSEPLMCQFKDRWYIAGVASHTKVGYRLTRRLYTSIHDYADWIKKTRDLTSRVSYKSQGLERLNAAGASDIKFNSTKWFEKFRS